MIGANMDHKPGDTEVVMSTDDADLIRTYSEAGWTETWVRHDGQTPSTEFAPEVVALVEAIQKATSLADLKARVNASPDLP